MKKCIFLLIILFVVFLISGCRYPAYIDYYSDIEDYEEIWDLTGFRHGYDEGEMFFPASLENYDVIDYLCRYDQQLPLGEGIQVYLEIQYPDETSLNAEIDRFSALSERCDEFFDKTGYEAYATRLGDEIGSSEYALIDRDNKKIYYIYLQTLPMDEIEFSHTLLPDGYEDWGPVEGAENFVVPKTGDGSVS